MITSANIHGRRDREAKLEQELAQLKERLARLEERLEVIAPPVYCGWNDPNGGAG